MADSIVASLPIEIVAEFLTHSILAPGSISRHRGPLLLTQICSLWRQIALRTPAIWTQIALPTNMPNLVEALEAWLQRSGGLPVTLELSGPPEKIKDFTGFAAALRAHSDRITSLELFQRCLNDLVMLGDSALELPHLETLLIEQDTERDPDLITFFGSGRCPRLSKVSLYEISPAGLVIPWTQITSFTGLKYSIEYAVFALRNAPNCTHLTLGIYETVRSGNPSPFTHPNIEHLSINTDPTEDQPHILTFFTFPALRSLEIADSDNLQPEVLEAFLERSAAPLESLLLFPDAKQDALSIKTFASLNHLTTLEIWHPQWEWVEDFHECFASDRTFLRRLESLTFGCRYAEMDETEADLQYFLDNTGEAATGRYALAETGAVSKCSIHIIAAETIYRINSKFDVSEEELAAFQALRAQGIMVYITVESSKL
ncbi:F-box domain-containing protein [Mycena kentingensis (nom. inval.)]|nr:F-box domain-containing protein [Mycena kentingensis (nom. inval.)]